MTLNIVNCGAGSHPGLVRLPGAYTNYGMVMPPDTRLPAISFPDTTQGAHSIFARWRESRDARCN